MGTRYKYILHPTYSQKDQMKSILEEQSKQWAKAVEIRKNLIASLENGDIDHVVRFILSHEKDNNQYARREAIQRLAASLGVSEAEAPRLYDVKLLVGDLFSDFGIKYADTATVVSKLKEMIRSDQEDIVISQLVSAINYHAGYVAIRYISHSFMAKKSAALGNYRSHLTGSGPGTRWARALALGEPRKKGFHSFSFSPRCEASRLIRNRKRGKGYLIRLTPLAKKSRLVIFEGGALPPEGDSIIEVTIKEIKNKYHLILYTETQ